MTKYKDHPNKITFSNVYNNCYHSHGKSGNILDRIWHDTRGGAGYINAGGIHR